MVEAPDNGRIPGQFPSHVQVAVIGAGVIGASVAYHLARNGCRDVLLLERRQVGCGTTWHSLGFVGLLRASPVLTKLALKTRQVIPEIEREAGRAAGYSERGSINLTADPSRLDSFRRVADIGRMLGLAVEEIDCAEAKSLLEILNPDGLLGGIHIPIEGQCNALDLTQTYLAAARKRGVRLYEETEVRDVAPDRGRSFRVSTSRGDVLCETLVNCTGIWARDFLPARRLNLPLQAVEQSYLVTEFSDEIPEGLRLMRDMDSTVAMREDARQLSIGFNEASGQDLRGKRGPGRLLLRPVAAGLGQCLALCRAGHSASADFERSWHPAFHVRAGSHFS